jgi:hypothetical protein
MVTKAETDFFSNEAAPYFRKSPLPLYLCTQSPELTSPELEAIKRSYRDVLGRQVDKQIVARHHPTNLPATLSSIRLWNSINTGPGTRLSNLGSAQRRRDPKEIFHVSESLAPELSFARILGWLSSVLGEKSHEEYHFYTRAQSPPSLLSNFITIVNFMDEIRSGIFSGGVYWAPLLELNCIDPHELRSPFDKLCHLIPEVRIYQEPRCINRDLERLLNSSQNVAIPMPLPITESTYHSEDPEKSHRKSKSARSADRRKDPDIMDLLEEKAYFRAQAVASAHIARFPDDWEMYLHRAFCLINEERFPDAVIDCSKSLEIKKTDKGLRMRSALWWKLGDFKLAKKDLKAMEDQNWAMNFLNNVRKRGMLGAIKAVS